MDKTVKWVLITLVALIAVLLLVKILKRSDDEGVKVTVDSVGIRSITETVNGRGKIYPETEVKVTSDFSGEITELKVQDGDSVNKGQVLAVMSNKFVGRANIIAPMSGIVSMMNVKSGERVVGTAQTAGTELMRIVDMSKFEVRVDVGENDIVKINVGDTADVEVDAYNNRKFGGVVTQIASSTSKTTGAGQLTSNDVTNYAVHIKLTAASYKDLIDPSKPKKFPFRTGMNASADIRTKTKDNVVAVPITSVAARVKNSDESIEDKKKEKASDAEIDDSELADSDELEEVVFVVTKDNTVERRSVKTGIQDINYIEIVSGLKMGEKVVTAPYSAINKSLRSGTKIKVVTKNKLFK